MSAVWTNPDGLKIYFGKDATERKRAVAVGTRGDIEQTVAIPFDVTEFTSAVKTYPDFIIPANSIITWSMIYFTTALADADAVNTVNVGLVRASDGSTAIDLDGIWDAVPEGTVVLVSDGDAGGAANTAERGDLVGAVSSATYDGIVYINTAVSDTPTVADAGAGWVVIRYIPPFPAIPPSDLS